LAVGLREGQQTVAVDYVAPEGAVLASRGHRFESIASWSAEDSPVDVLTLWDVYEHLSDPNAFFALAARRLRSGGRLLVQTPNASIHADILGARWHHFLPVQHLQLPSRLGLVAHAQRFGFNLLHACSFGANAPPEVVPQPYKRLFDTLAKQADLGSTQIVLFERP
jgi:cyclopropane fatty-acyl-phospholipid synthase-like methyltransferase